jgi:hypothetical protein
LTGNSDSYCLFQLELALAALTRFWDQGAKATSLRTWKSGWKVLVQGIPEAGLPGLADRQV